MKDRRSLLLPVVLLIAVAMAFLLRGAFQSLIIYPIAKLLFIIRGYYGAMAQAAYWPFILLVVVLLGVSGLRVMDWNVRLGGDKKIELHGDVYQMAFWLERLNTLRDSFSRNPYPRWYVARTLADLAVDMLNRQGTDTRRTIRLEGPGWNPPPNIQKYLQIALQSNPATFSNMLDAAGLDNVPEVETVIQYLESFVESSR